MSRRWARINTSQWHLVHSIRAGTRRSWHTRKDEPYEFILTTDGYDLPTEIDTREFSYEKQRTVYTGKKKTGAKVWEGEGYPPGRACSNCSSFVALQKDTVEVG